MVAQTLPWIAMVLELLTLVGLVVRGHVRATVLLPVWLLAHVAVRLTLALRPDLDTWDFWDARQAALLLLTIVLGLELGARMATRLPGLRRALTRDVVVLGLFVTVSLTLELPGPVTTRVLPVLAAGAAVFFILLMVEVYFFYVPLTPLHRTLLLGVPITSLLYCVTWYRAADDTTLAGYANAAAFALFLLTLCRVAWRREPAPNVPAELVHLLQPWRA